VKMGDTQTNAMITIAITTTIPTNNSERLFACAIDTWVI